MASVIDEESVPVLLNDPPESLLTTAMSKRVCVTAVYNRAAVTLAPHSVFERHGDLFLRAMTVEHDGRKPAEARLGTFKLAGLSGLTLTRKLFSLKQALKAGELEKAA